MDLVSIGLSAVLSAVLFIILEFSVILPLFRKIVTKAVNDMVTNSLVPSVNSFVDQKVTDLTETLTKSLFQKFKGFLGGRKKGINSILERLASGEDLEDIEDDYEPSTIDKVLDIIEMARPYLPDPNTRKKTSDNEVQDGIREL